PDRRSFPTRRSSDLFPLDERELFDHFRNAAVACDPLPFYIYEFVGRSGYPVPIPVIERLRDEVPNLAGLKVSDTPFEAVKPYLLDRKSTRLNSSHDQ